MQQPFVAPGAGGPNPSVAAVLGVIPGVGAMYNGQYFKGLIHVVIFVVIISITTHYGIFGLFIPAWILYQSFEAFHTAKAIRDGQPIPDPLGLNEVGNWLNLGGPQHRQGMPISSVPPGPGRGAGGHRLPQHRRHSRWRPAGPHYPARCGYSHRGASLQSRETPAGGFHVYRRTRQGQGNGDLSGTRLRHGSARMSAMEVMAAR